MEIYSAFVTGANRGIGLEFVKQLVQLQVPPAFVFATYRSREGMQPLKSIRDSTKKTQVVLIKMDVTIKSEIEAARKITEDMVGERGLTLLISNAGVGGQEKFPHIEVDNMLRSFKTNIVGPTLVVQEFYPLLKKAASRRESGMSVNRAAVLNISAELGSITSMSVEKVGFPQCPSYNISKASVNMMMRVIAAKVKDDGILVVSMCPGWVKTDMGSNFAELEVNDSVSAMLGTLATLNETHHGSFMSRNGNPFEF